MQSFFARITPIDPRLRPTHPIAPGGGGYWGQANDPNYGIEEGLGIWGGSGERFPTNPIAGPGRPPWWGMAQDPGYSPPWARPPVDPGFGNPWFDPHPSHPIYLPPSPVDPGYSPPWARPTPPVDPGYSPPWAQVPDLPDTLPPAQGSGGEPVPVTWKTGWSAATGWVVVGIPTGPTPTPSKV